jgi:hypothetical protein
MAVTKKVNAFLAKEHEFSQTSKGILYNFLAISDVLYSKKSVYLDCH